MKQFLLALVLIAVPVSAFTAYQLYNGGTGTTATPDSASFGDLSPYQTIVTDAQSIAAGGDMTAAGKRMTDFESAWDKAQPTLRALDADAWGNIDDAHDKALQALRAGKPEPGKVEQALTALATTLDHPSAGSGGTPGGEVVVAGVTITDGNGRALPCEEMLKTYRAEMAAATLSVTDKPKVDAFLGKGTERCNADDDRHADEFFAQGLALVRP